MKTTEGVVFRVHTKEWKDKNLYSFKLDGGGDNEWYRMGEKRYEGEIEEGYTVKVGYEEDRNGNLQVKKVKVMEKGEPVKAKGRSSGNSGSGGGGARGGNKSGGAVDWDAKDANIQYQSARKDALEMMKILIEGEIVKLPPKTKADERLAAIEGYVDLYTARFFADIASKGAVGRTSDEFDAPERVDTGSEKAADTSSDEDWGDDNDGDDGDEW